MLQTMWHIKTSMQISYDPPDPANGRYAKSILKIAGCCSSELEDSDESREAKARRKERLDLFLAIWNGDWRNPVPTHHCSVYCACGGCGSDKVAELAANLYIEIALSSKPRIPALNRWLRCLDTARWYA